uniref:Uncharacterized protein n=1 Tax=Anopheles albimanus TaxID=7167 RepID=A0A182FX01_ANOAL
MGAIFSQFYNLLVVKYRQQATKRNGKTICERKREMCILQFVNSKNKLVRDEREMIKKQIRERVQNSPVTGTLAAQNSEIKFTRNRHYSIPRQIRSDCC